MKKNTKKGFTLVELLVVIAILAILASVAVVGYTAFINKAKESNAKTEAHQIDKAIESALLTLEVGDIVKVADEIGVEKTASGYDALELTGSEDLADDISADFTSFELDVDVTVLVYISADDVKVNVDTNAVID